MNPATKERAGLPEAPAVPAWHLAVHRWDALPRLNWPAAHEDGRFKGYVYQTREFLETWMGTVGRARKSEGHLIVLSDAHGRNVLHLAVVVEPDHGCRVLRFPDAGMADYNAPLLDAAADNLDVLRDVWPSILASLPRLDAVDLIKMPERIGDTPNPLLPASAVEDDEFGYYMPIEGTAKDYFADPARKQTVRKLQQRLRKLERAGATTIDSPGEPEAIAAAGAFIELHKGAQYRRTLGFDQFDKPGIRAFVRALLAPEALGRFSQLTVMQHEGRIAAAQLDFRTPRQHQGFLTTFDQESFHASSPGRQVTMKLIERAYEDGLAVFDLGHGENAFKAPWMTQRMRLFRAEMALTWRGQLYLLLRRVRRGVRSRLAERRSSKAAASAEAVSEAQPG
jgi:CelD/BcsL family acetyltransferase involved in cellulose biosynthesis